MTEIPEDIFDKERELQTMIESNLETIFSLKFVATEFPVAHFRLDTVAFDEDTKSFVILEYKKGKLFSVVDQGYAYLNALLENKGEFVLAYNEQFPKQIKTKKEIDWSQTRVVFVANDYTSHQYGAINNPDLPIDLVKAKKYKNGLMDIQFLNKTSSFQREKSKQKTANKISLSKEIKVYTEDEHLSLGLPEIQELYEELKTIILSWDSSIQIKPVKLYNSFKLKRNIVDIGIQKNALKIWINLKSGELHDSENVARDVSQIGHWGNGDYEIRIKDNQNIEYISSLIKQSWRYHRNSKDLE
jgi:predicted transport protein